MHCSRTVGIVAILVAVTFAVSPEFFASSGGMVGSPGGCHGHHGPMPLPFPAHNCCFAAHQIPAVGPIAPPQVALDACETDLVNTASVGQAYRARAARVLAANTSPPLIAVLRI